MVSIFKKADVALIIFILLFSVAFYFLSPQQTGNKILVKLNGIEYCNVSLNEDAEIKIFLENGHHVNTVIIHNGYAEMQYASCPDVLCINHGTVHRVGEIIVCLPNRVTVEILGESPEFDGILR